MSEIIKNDSTTVEKGYEMNDKDYLNDVLLSFKHLVSSYGIALNEASNKEIYKLFFNLLETTSKIQFDLFECAFKNGWYQLETVDEKKIEKTHDKFTKCLSELCYEDDSND